MLSSRKEALASNQVRYFTGKPCKNGHIEQRYAKTGTCVVCMHEHQARWAQENYDRRRNYERDRRKDPVVKRRRKAQWDSWYEDNPKYSAFAMSIHRMRRLGHNPKMPWQDLDELKQFYYDTPEGMTVDHIIPIKNDLVCGLNVVANLQYLTKEENDKKGNSFVVE